MNEDMKKYSDNFEEELVKFGEWIFSLKPDDKKIVETWIWQFKNCWLKCAEMNKKRETIYKEALEFYVKEYGHDPYKMKIAKDALEEAGAVN